jgi:glycosyltransferase involved in cell wall biosynthesis
MLLQFNDNFHAQITPVKEATNRPLWSVIVPTYNCALYLKETLDSIINQNIEPGKMEIIVVDDNSTKDNPEAVLNCIASPNRVVFIKHANNIGKANNYASGLTLAKGNLIHILHGDDYVLPGFYNEMESIFNSYPDICAAFCQANYINQQGIVYGKTGEELPEMGVIENWIEKIAISQRIQPPSLVIKREVYETLGGYDNRLKYFEDWEMYARIGNYYKVGFTPKALVCYRVHQNSSSQTSIKNGTRIKTLHQVIDIMNSYLNPVFVTNIKALRNRAMAQYLIQYIPKVIKAKDFITYVFILKGVLGFSINLKTIYQLLYFTVFWKKLLKSE